MSDHSGVDYQHTATFGIVVEICDATNCSDVFWLFDESSLYGWSGKNHRLGFRELMLVDRNLYEKGREG